VRVWAISVGQLSLWRTTAIVALPSTTCSGTALQCVQVNTAATVSVCIGTLEDSVNAPTASDHRTTWLGGRLLCTGSGRGGDLGAVCPSRVAGRHPGVLLVGAPPNIPTVAARAAVG
jgi:hypothetical protein